MGHTQRSAVAEHPISPSALIPAPSLPDTLSMYAAAKLAAFDEVVALWRRLLKELRRQGAPDADIATFLEIPPQQLDGIPAMYWIVGAQYLLFRRYNQHGADWTATQDAGYIAPNTQLDYSLSCPRTRLAVNNLPTG